MIPDGREGTMPKERRSAHLDADTARVDRVVQSLTGASRAGVRGMFDHGCVSVDGVACAEAGMPAPRGALVEVVFDPRHHYREKPPERPSRAYRVAFEDGHLIVVEKNAGILTVPTARRERDTLVHAVAARFSRGRVPQVAHVVHRLDRDTSGLLVFARTDAVAQALKRQFADRKPEREYAAIVAGHLERDAGTFRSYLAVDEDLDEVSSDDPREGRLAITHFEVVERLRRATFVRVRLETGRRNQIRVHFADAGHPVLGDTRYSPAAARHPAWREDRLALHARTLGFVHPVTGRPVRVTTDLPPVFEAFLAATREGR
jgi:23S rRNA pseudouridine1911/1915/1917 synthase